ncbi:MAG: NUDIX hydrolase [bacterium]|nr:NUDIX hydrolase [bacterium]
MDKWKTLSSTLAFDHRWFKVRQDTVELPNGKILDDFFVYLQGDVALVVPVTQNNEFIMVRQYKHASGEILIEFPAGMIDAGENPDQAAQRELEEETGYSSNKISLLGILKNSPTKTVEDLHVYLAESVINDKEIHLDPNEEIEVLVIPYAKMLEMIYAGEIKVTGTITAFFLACKKLDLSIQ